MKLDQQDLLEWQRHPVTIQVWKELSSSYDPKEWMTSPPEMMGKLQGRWEILDRVKLLFDESKNSHS